MPVVAFWSKNNKETAQTLSMVAIATHMAVEHNFKVLMVDTYFDNPTIANCYWDNKVVGQNLAIKKLNQGKIDLGTGTSGLAQLVASGKDSPDMIKDYTRVIYKNRLEVLTKNKANSETELARLEGSFPDIIKTASRYYDYDLVDLQKGLNKQFVRDILEFSDIIIVNLTQRLLDLDDFKELTETNDLFKSNKVIPVVGRYDRYSKYSKKNIARYLGIKGEISAVPYNTLFFESANEGMISNYFLKFRMSLMDSSDRNAVFIQDITSTTNYIIDMVKALQMGF